MRARRSAVHRAGAALARYPIVFFPLSTSAESPPGALNAAAAAKLAAYERGGGAVVRGSATPAAIAAALAATHHLRVVEGMPDAVFARSSDPAYAGFLIATNYGDEPRTYANVRVRTYANDRARSASGTVITLPRVHLGARDGAVIPLPLRAAQGDKIGDGEPHLACEASRRARRPELVEGATLALRADARLPIAASARRTVAAGEALVYSADLYEDGMPAFVLQNALVRIVVSPQAGARAFAFEDLASGDNAFTSVGALRDDVALEPPLSTADRIAKYTHDFPPEHSTAATPAPRSPRATAPRCCAARMKPPTPARTARASSARFALRPASASSPSKSAPRSPENPPNSQGNSP